MRAARDGALLGFFLGGTVAVMSLACYAIGWMADPRAVGFIWGAWAFLLWNFWYANSEIRKLIDKKRAQRRDAHQRADQREEHSHHTMEAVR